MDVNKIELDAKVKTFLAFIGPIAFEALPN